MTINVLHVTCEFVGNKGEAFVGLMGRSISGEGEHKALKRKKKKIKSALHIQQSGFLKYKDRMLTEAVCLTDSLNRIIPASAAIDVLEKPHDQGE